MNKTVWIVETTDSIGGVANGSWVNRIEISLDNDLNKLQLVRVLRKVAGLNGSNAKTQQYGEGFMWKHTNAAILTFAYPMY
jgi:hypothetical protein